MLRDHLGWAHFTAEESEAPQQITWLMSHKQGSPRDPRGAWQRLG